MLYLGAEHLSLLCIAVSYSTKIMENNNTGLNKILKERNMKVQKLYREGLEHTLNTTISNGKGEVTALHVFSNMEEMHEKANETGRKFEEVLSSVMEQKQFPRHLYQILEEQKKEAQSVLKEYDDIILQLNDDLNDKSAKYRQKIEYQSMQLEEIRKRIETLISELNRVGKEEICSIRTEIVKHSKCVLDTFGKNNEMFFQNTEADKPFDSYLWKKPSEMLTLQQLEDAFLVDHTETFKLRRSLLSEVCKLRNELEKEKLNYILKKQNFEQEIFYLKENYNQNMPVVAKMKRKCIILRDKRDRLVRELKTLDDLIKKESKMKEEAKFKDQNTLKLDASCARNAACSCYRKVLRDYQERASTLQSRILYEENLFYNYILEKPWRNAALIFIYLI
ncbi:uncharacterized protein LOC129972170 isoform X3 [Argiope bruennichi]|uniref:uncharacterized protein LOC129972170 isoform X3 n=1 Tax=Argiope bruennichi TaxID=94029 RepID=UPI002494DB61|nr:uncharacterized protein LOC129972170 isoform X3 [Argiope bruennichi]